MDSHQERRWEESREKRREGRTSGREARIAGAAVATAGSSSAVRPCNMLIADNAESRDKGKHGGERRSYEEEDRPTQATATGKNTSTSTPASTAEGSNMTTIAPPSKSSHQQWFYTHPGHWQSLLGQPGALQKRRVQEHIRGYQRLSSGSPLQAAFEGTQVGTWSSWWLASNTASKFRRTSSIPTPTLAIVHRWWGNWRLSTIL